MKDAVARFLTIFTMLFVFTACSSCVTNSYLFGEGSLFRDKRRSFIKINTYRRVSIVRTSTANRENVIEDYKVEMSSTASGVILKHYRDVTLVATSAHVCSIKHGNQIRIFAPEYKYDSPYWHVLERSMFSLSDLNGKKTTGIILKIDYMSDLCVLASRKINKPEVKISLMDPIVGEKYYNVAAPRGIWAKKLVPLLEGRFVGKAKSPFTGGDTYMFTIPATGGSSGSPIFNWYGEVVGLLHSAYGGFHHICMAATNDQLNVLLLSSLTKLRKQYDSYKVILSLHI
jgi:S1-C subfamily serine protease